MRTHLMPILIAALLAPPLVADEGELPGSGPLETDDQIEALDQMRDQIQAADEDRANIQATPSVRSMNLGEPAEPIEPQQADIETSPARVGMPAAKVDLDPSVVGVAPGERPSDLLREGQFIVNRRGHLRREGDVLLFVFELRQGQQRPDTPMVLEACKTLEIIEDVAETRGSDMPLIVSGQVHTYRGFNYLLPTMLEPAQRGSPPPAEQTQPEAPAEPQASAEPADAAEPEDEEAAGDDLMAELMQMRPEDAPMSDEAPPAQEEEPADLAQPLIESIEDLVPATAAVTIDRALIGIAPDQALPPLRREGEFVMSRRGRLVRSGDGKQVLFVFDADSAASPELPMVVQPCQLRQSMEDVVLQRGDNVVFIVSGQVHTYRGANYLLPTMMKLAVDKGNLLN